MPLSSSQSCYARNYLLSCILLAALSLLGEESLLLAISQVASHLGVGMVVWKRRVDDISLIPLPLIALLESRESWQRMKGTPLKSSEPQ